MPKYGGSSRSQKKNIRETAEKSHAFEIYMSLPDSERSYRKVAELVGKSESSIQGWGLIFNWQSRLEERMKRQSEITALKLDFDIAEERAKMIAMIDTSLKRMLRWVKGRQEIEHTPGELARLLAIRADLLGIRTFPEQLNPRKGDVNVYQKIAIIIDDLKSKPAYAWLAEKYEATLKSRGIGIKEIGDSGPVRGGPPGGPPEAGQAPGVQPPDPTP